jgi:sterol desaturase/sphingolipid hydroxylase (fatty acid hydroxylase superfamily)
MSDFTKILFLNGLMGVFLICEFMLLKAKKLDIESSLTKILKQNSFSAKCDTLFWVCSQTIIPVLNSAGVLWMLSLMGMLNTFIIDAYSVQIEVGLLSNVFEGFENNRLITWLLWFVAIDFAIYVTHVMMHKIPVFWEWHKFHHAAEDFCVLTSARFALSETFFGSIIQAVIINVVLGLPEYNTIIVLVVGKLIFEWMHHSNLPFDYGVLGRVFVSPRFHRFHHSKLIIDRDRNFGADLAIWDYLFGTISKRFHNNPALGSEVPIGVEGLPDYKNSREILKGYVPEFYFLVNKIRSGIMMLWKNLGSERKG